VSTPAGPTGILRDWINTLLVEFTIFPNVQATSFQRRALTIPEIAAWIFAAHAEADTTEAAKKLLELLKLGGFGKKKTPIRTNAAGKRIGGSLRHDGNFEFMTGIEADYDGEQISFDEAHEHLTKAGVLGILYTSPSHTEDAPRWRFLAFFSRPIFGQEGGESTDRMIPKHDMYMSWLNGIFQPAGCFAAECWTLTQSYYVGLTNGNPSHRVEIIDGVPLDLLPELDLSKIGKPASLQSQRPRLIARDGQAVLPDDPNAALVDEAELKRLIRSGESMHPSMTALAGKLKRKGMIPVWNELDELLDSCDDELKATDRWKERKAEVPEIIEWAFGRDAMRKAQRKQERKDTRDERKANLDETKEAAEAVTPELPEIRVMGGLRHVAADMAMRTMRAVAVPFYQRDVKLVRVAGVKSKASDGTEVTVPGIIPVTSPMLARAMGTSARWRRLNKAGDMIRIDPPKEVVEQVASMVGEWPFDPLLGVIGTATLRSDCSLLTAPGYDTRTGLYLHAPPRMPEIPPRPTKAHAYAALLRLDELLTDFPFADDTSRSVGMSMLMTPVLRGALGQAVPMHCVTAPTPGTGKSYLGDLASVIAIGERCAVMTVAPKEEETEKRLIAAALSGRAIIALDNCNGVLTGDFLAQVTERPRLMVRPLGGSDHVTISNAFTVFANGNNIVIAADMVRRTVRCTLDANVEDPGARTFSGDPVSTVMADRGKYVAAILTIARAYHLAGEPYTGRTMHSYDRWSRLVAGALVWLGWETPIKSVSDLRAEDPERQILALALECFPDVLTSYSTQDLVAEAEAKDSYDQPTNPVWLEVVSAISRNRLGKLDPNRLGVWLRDHRGRVVNDRKLERTGTDTRPRWTVVKV
jgi:putative DNA primase/helicase